mmetsp:Transcript_28097/g.80641  ORF Transcript_28097/g.80641 Transcript_28097/m.80641 type:complete len:203 (-) Transcript_28097:326-934(-)
MMSPKSFMSCFRPFLWCSLMQSAPRMTSFTGFGQEMPWGAQSGMGISSSMLWKGMGPSPFGAAGMASNSTFAASTPPSGSPMPRRIAEISERRSRKGQGFAPPDQSSQTVMPTDQASALWLSFASATVSGAHHLTACGCFLMISVVPSGKTKAKPMSVILTSMTDSSSSSKWKRRQLRQDKSQCTIRSDSRNTIAREIWNAA